MTIESTFREFLSNIEPTESQVQESKSGHETLRKRLENDEDLKDLLAGDTFLSGSYRRHTAIKPVKDVDIIIPLNLEEDTTPRKCLEIVRDVLTKYYKAPSLEDQRRSIRVDLSYVTMDIVPGWAKNGVDEPLEIPDRKQRTWIDSHPKRHTEYIQKLNGSSDGMLVPLIKALKRWKAYRIPDVKHPKSFFLECLVANGLPLEADSMGGAVHNLLQCWVDEYRDVVDVGEVPRIPDPGIPEQDLVTGMTADEFKAFYEDIIAAEEIAARALAADNSADRAKEWRKLFGEEFPDAEDSEKHALEIFQPRYGVKIFARLAPRQDNRVLRDRYPSGGRALPKNWNLRFEIEKTDVPDPYEIRWRVENHGPEACAAGDVGHIKFPGSRTHWEATKYTGAHYMYCEIIKDGEMVARARHVVRIGKGNLCMNGRSIAHSPTLRDQPADG